MLWVFIIIRADVAVSYCSFDNIFVLKKKNLGNWKLLGIICFWFLVFILGNILCTHSLPHPSSFPFPPIIHASHFIQSFSLFCRVCIFSLSFIYYLNKIIIKTENKEWKCNQSGCNSLGWRVEFHIGKLIQASEVVAESLSDQFLLGYSDEAACGSWWVVTQVFYKK